MKTVCTWIVCITLALAIVFGLTCLSAVIFMFLWNWIMPLFGVITLTFWQSWGLQLLIGVVASAFTRKPGDLKHSLEDLRTSMNNMAEPVNLDDIVEEEPIPVPVDIKVDVTVNSSDKVETNATVNDTPMEKVKEEVVVDTPAEPEQPAPEEQPVPETPKEEVVKEEPAPVAEAPVEKPAKKPSRRRKPKKANNNSDSPTL